MKRLVVSRLILVLLLGEATTALPAYADNAMGYRLLSEQQANVLPRHRGAIGITVGRAQQINDASMRFDILRVTAVRPGSPGAAAGFRQGDQIIAVNGMVFPSLNSFAAYVGSLEPGSVATVDYMPAGAGPAQAQRAAVTVAAPGAAPGQAVSQAPRNAYSSAYPDRAAPSPDDRGQNQGGLSAGAKVAIGAGAVALLGCYEFGCFSHHHQAAPQRR